MCNEVNIMQNYKDRIVQPNVGQCRVALYENLGRIFGGNLKALPADGVSAISPESFLLGL